MAAGKDLFLNENIGLWRNTPGNEKSKARVVLQILKKKHSGSSSRTDERQINR